MGLLRKGYPPAPQGMGERTVTMVSASGKPFLCTIPGAQQEPQTSAPAVPPAAAAEEEPPQPLATRLHKVLSNRCLTKQSGYWSYEVCPYKSVRQFRAGDSQGLQFQLGTYDESLDKEENGKYTQTMVGGTDGRVSQVTYVCNQHALSRQNKHMLFKVTEEVDHIYELEVHTTLACDKGSTAAKQRLEEPTAADLLAPLKGTCDSLATGWWTYKYCFQEGITQFHKEKVSVKPSDPEAEPRAETVVTAEFDLGHLGASGSEAQLQVVVVDNSWQESYVSQVFTDGTSCDLTGELRRTEVRHFCDPNEASKLRSVEETSSCQYRAVVHTRALCALKELAPAQPKVREIVCVPAEQGLGQQQQQQAEDEEEVEVLVGEL